MSGDEAAQGVQSNGDSSFFFASSIHSLRARAIFFPLVTAAYALVFLPLQHTTGDAAAALTILPVAATGWLMGLRMGFFSVLLFIPVNIALLNFVGKPGEEVTVAHWPWFASLLLAGVTVGWLSGLFKATREQSHALKCERESLAREIAEHRLTEGALQEAIAGIETEKAKFKAILEAMGDGVTINDTNFRITYQNETLKNVMGDRVGEYCYRVYRGKEEVCDGCPLVPSSGNGGIHSLRTAIQTANGMLHAEITASLLKDASGKVIAGIEVVRDISERKLVEDALRQTNETLQTLINGAPLAITLIDAKGNALIWNPAAERLFGWSEEEVLGRPVPIIPPAERDEFQTMIDAQLKGETRVGRESRRLRKDGSFIGVNSWTELLRGPQGRIIGVIVMFVDITKRLRMEEALAEIQSQQQAILDNIPDLVWLKNTENRFIIVNEAFSSACGVNGKMLAGKTDFDIWPPDLAKKYRDDDIEVMMSGRQKRTEELLADPGGNRIWIETIKMPIFNNRGETVGTTGIARNINERKRVEQELFAYQEQLKSLAAELSLAEERERRRIATELHDQLSQNLAFTRMKLNLLERSELSPGDADSVKQIMALIDRTIQGVRSLTCQISPPLLYEVGFEAAVEWLGERFQEEQGFRVEFRDERGVKPLDEEIKVALFQVVRELLMNIAKHAKANRVKISVGKTRDGIKVTVEDDGAGFDMSKVMAQRDKKCGFGLFNIRQKMAHLGGEIDVTSEIGCGTRVTLLAPLKMAKTEEGGK